MTLSAHEVLDGAVAGTGLAAAWFAWRRCRALAWSEPRTAWLSLEGMALPMAVWALLLLVVPYWTTGLEQRGAWPAASGLLLGGIVVHAVAGWACFVVAARTFPGGWHGFLLADSDWRTHMRWGAVGMVAAFPFVWAALALSTFALQRAWPDFEPPTHDVLEMLGQAGQPMWLVALLWVGAAVVAPIAEEAFFRGLLQTTAVRLIGHRAGGVGLTAAAFGLAHGSQPQEILPLVVLGAMLGIVYEARRGLLAPIIMHALFNLKTLVFLSWFGPSTPA